MKGQTKTTATDEAGETSSASINVNRRNSAFRRELLEKLPVLGYPDWRSGEVLEIQADLESIVQVDTDSFLEPLEHLAELKSW